MSTSALSEKSTTSFASHSLSNGYLTRRYTLTQYTKACAQLCVKSFVQVASPSSSRSKNSSVLWSTDIESWFFRKSALMLFKLSSVFYTTLILISLHRKNFIVDSKHVGLQSKCNVQAISCSCKENYGLEEYVTVELCLNHTKSPCQVEAVMDQCRKQGKLIEFTSSLNLILH